MNGLCECGCGQATAIRARSRPGLPAGQPCRWIPGHAVRLPGPGYEIDTTTGCWVWQRGTTPDGYALAWDKSRRSPRRVHSMLYERHVGPVPEGLELDHLCRNRRCVNPAHLEPVTRSVNSQRGATAKVTTADVVAIRAKRAAGASLAELATQYGIHASTLASLARGASWRNVPNPVRNS